MRDITRGGLATVLSEVAVMCKLGIHIEEEKLPIREHIHGICEIYGFNPLFLANEGKVMLVISEESADKALEIMKQHEFGIHARIIGSVTETNPSMVLMKSLIGSTRIIDKLTGEQLPRIC
jgi:hydrogenase expression/formation protein HypE